MERFFAAAGFHVLRDARLLPFAEQLRLYARAACLAGFEGSGLHNSVFMQEPGRAVIELVDNGRRNVQQELLVAMNDVRLLRVRLSANFSEEELRDRLARAEAEPQLRACAIASTR